MTEKITTTSCECCRHTERTERERKRLMTRLKTMEGQIRGRVAEDIREGKEDKVDELCAMLEKLMK